MVSRSLIVALLISIFSISSLNAQNLIWDINASVINGFSVDLMITNYQKNSSVGIGYSFVGYLPEGKNYSNSISEITYSDDIQSIQSNTNILELKYGQLVKQNLMPFALIGIGWKNEIQQRYDDSHILDVSGKYYISKLDEVRFNLGFGIRQRIVVREKNYFSFGIESSYLKPFCISIGISLSQIPS